MQTFIRPEARPVAWELLDSEQQRAFDQLAQMIAESIQILPEADDRARGTRTASWPNEHRSSRTAFLSGARGSGKTTVLASLTKACDSLPRSSVTQSANEILQRGTQTEMPERTRHALDVVRQNALWLEPLDMEAVPDSSNLLTAILARIEDSVSRQGSPWGPEQGDRETRMPALFEPSNEPQEALRRLQRTQVAIAQAWEGNLNVRSAALDSDAFAVELLRAERSRLNLNESVAETLARLSQN